jgi:glycosyltransferase involved in cell wall biosynthesis
MLKLSIVVPIFNEENTIILILNRIKEVELIKDVKKEVILINDCSSDETDLLICNFIKENPSMDIVYHVQEFNQGKGASIHKGIYLANGDFILVQDADLEYDPDEYNILLKPIINGHADVVYGSRFIGGNPHRILFFWHTIGNKFLTML